MLLGPKRLDGRPVPVPVLTDGHASGHDGSLLEESFSAALGSSLQRGASLPRSIYETVDKSLAYAGAGCPTGKNCYPCTPFGPAFGGSPPVYPQHDPTVSTVPSEVASQGRSPRGATIAR